MAMASTAPFSSTAAPWPSSSRLSLSSFPGLRSPKLNMWAPLQATTVSALQKKPHLWKRYVDWIYQRKDIGLYLDVSRIRFSDEFVHKAFLGLVKLEGNSDEKRMVGHHNRTQIDDALDRVSLFAADIVSGKAVFNCNGLLLPSGNVNMHITGNRAMLKIVGYAQGARGLNVMREKYYREPSLPCLKAAARSESREETNDVKLEDAKKALIRAVANTNRGKNATLEQRKHILKMINELENANPTKYPVKSPSLSGYWSLLYTGPVDESTSDKYAGTQEGPFLARIKPLAFGSIRQTRSSQVIDVEGGVAKNIADFTFLGKDGTLTIKGNAAPSSVNGKETIRLDVMFEEFSVRIGAWISPNVSLGWINPQGWVDTTFLDEDMRVGRGDKGSVFVSVRVKM